MKAIKLYVGTKEPGGKVETYKSLRLDVFHSSQSVKDLLAKWVDEIYDEYSDEDNYDYDPGVL